MTEEVIVRLDRTASLALMGAFLALAACKRGSSGSSEPAPVFTVHGGAGSDGAGGEGGEIYVGGSGSTVVVKQDGGLGTLPTWTYTAPNLGANPLTIDADTAFTVDGPPTGDDGINPATGIWVKSGATVTLSPPDGEDTSEISLSDGLLVEGTIVLAPLAGTGNASSLGIEAKSIAVRGTVQATGADAATGEAGGNGGDLTASVSESFFLTGKVLTNGGQGDTGGIGGDIDVGVAGPEWSVDVTPGVIAITGRADASGGVGLAGAGGGSGDVNIYGSWDAGGACSFFNSGTVRANGGNGTTEGGKGQYVYVSACRVGSAVNTGTLEASGGSATTEGGGGATDFVEIDSLFGITYAGGTLSSSGGKGAGAGAGGAGGEIDIFSYGQYYDWAYGYGPEGQAVGVHVAAKRLDASGGDGATGGAGGTVNVWNGGLTIDEGVTVAGFGILDLAGGGGTTLGGQGGSATIESHERYDATLDDYLLGTVENGVRIVATGGDASAGVGGHGGSAFVGAYLESVAPSRTPTRSRRCRRARSSRPAARGRPTAARAVPSGSTT